MNTSSFPQFTSLPLELRLLVWKFSIAPIESEVCIAWPLNLRGSLPQSGPNKTREVTLPLTVDTSFSVLMHVCQESRQLAQNTRISGIRYRASTMAGCQVPFRLYCPELDTLYFSKHNARGLVNLLNSDSDIVSRIRYLALDCFTSMELVESSNTMKRKCLALRSISGVFPTEAVSANWARAEWYRSRLPQPYRRCKLVRSSEQLPENLGQEEIKLLLRGMPWCVVQHALRRVGRYETQKDGTRLALPVVQAKMFTVRQKDGSWVKGYSAREADFTPNRPPWIPMEARGDPEQARVLDSDGFWEIEQE